MSLSETQVQNELADLDRHGKEPLQHRSARNIKLAGNDVSWRSSSATPAKASTSPPPPVSRRSGRGAAGVRSASASKVVAHLRCSAREAGAGHQDIIAVAWARAASASPTTAVNLALALAAEGASVGVLDADMLRPLAADSSASRAPGIERRQAPRADGGARPAGDLDRLPHRS